MPYSQEQLNELMCTLIGFLISKGLSDSDATRAACAAICQLSVPA